MNKYSKLKDGIKKIIENIKPSEFNSNIMIDLTADIPAVLKDTQE